MPFCRKCGRGIDQGATFCEYCGASNVPAKASIDPILLVIVLLEIVFLAALGLWSGSLVLAIVAIVINVATLGVDLVLRHRERAP